MFFGLIGEKLGHSYSLPIHDFFGDYEYRLFELKKDEIADFAARDDLLGFNITIPYKKEVIRYLDTVDPVAERIGAVNTVVKRDGKLFGYNTDYYGVSYMLNRAGILVKGKKTLVLGSGGACSAVKAYLNDNGADYKVVSRSGEINYDNVYEEKDAEIIINATPVGMFPDYGKRLIDLKRFPRLTAAVDLIYNPLRTLFLFDAENLGIKTANGLSMLVSQAKAAHDLFLGKDFSDDKIEECIKALETSMKNVVLIGMSGSGKSAIAKELGRKLGRTVIDTDSEIVKRAGKSIENIFAKDGEAAFRKLETEVLKDVCKRRGVIIATGGGVVTVPENEYYLKSNGVVVRIVRAEDKLARKGRPLVKTDENFKKLIAEREPLYKKFADVTVNNDKTVQFAVNKITEIL